MKFDNIGVKVRALRKERGLTQEKLAEMAEISIKVSNPHFKWGFNFYPSRVYSWFRQRRGFAAPLLLVAR